jgi:RNA polymerase sigma-70 factor (ECF subfamily)
MRTGGDDEQERSSNAAAFYCASLVADAQAPHSAAVIDAVSGEPSDEALMLAYRDGDGAAFRLLYSRHRGGLYRFLLRQCGAAAIAEELFQDVWFNLIRARSRYVAEARFATYLYRIAHNRLVDHFRRASHRVSVGSGDEDDDPVALLAADARDQPEVGIETRARIERFMSLLAALPDEQREAFVLREEAGLSVQEIAQTTGVNAETAKSRLRYAVAKLRRGMLELL